MSIKKNQSLMQEHVSARFLECLDVLKKENKIRSTRQFALSLDIHPQCISDVSTGKRTVNNEMITKSVAQYNFNPTYLFTGKGSKFNNENETFDLLPVDPVITVVTDDEGLEKIVHVPISAQAGYGNHIHDPKYFNDLPSFTLPGEIFKNGTYRCFDVSGDSMEPTLFSGDKVVCSFVESDHYFNCIRDNYVYIIVTNNSIYVKRVNNLLKKKGVLLISSDNKYYETFEIELVDIKEVWKVTHKISTFMPSPSNIRNALHTEVDSLKNIIADQSRMIKSLNATVEKLLKQNRSNYSRI